VTFFVTLQGKITIEITNLRSCFQVGATDADEDHYGSVTYSIVDGAYGMFVIDNMTGWINTTSQLDREDRENYILTVRASDGKDAIYLIFQEDFWEEQFRTDKANQYLL
jgi:hypothetical protein